MKTTKIHALAGVVLAGTAAGVSVAWANEAPTAPPEFMAVAVSSTQIQLTWDPSTDDKRVRRYQLQRDGMQLASTRNTQYLDNSAQPGINHTYTIVASDGSLLSTQSTFTIDTPLEDPVDDTTPSKPRKGKGKNRPDVEDPPVDEPPADDPPADDPPADDPGTDDPIAIDGVPAGWSLVFNEEFDGSGELDTTSEARNWRIETMDDGLHRAGNTGIDELGNLGESWRSPRGKRWSGWYNDHGNRNIFRQNGELVMGGYFSGEQDPTRPIDYVDNGVLTQYGSSKLYTGWIDTFSRVYVGPGDLHVVDPESPGISFRYGYFETRVNFSEMMTPGFRLSFWLMPASSDAEGQNLLVSNAYDNDGNNGVEIDIFEYEWINTDFENRINLALQGGAAGSRATNYDASQLGMNLHEGYHTIGLLWEADKLIWSLNGRVIKEIYDLNLIPDVYSYMILSREMNSGVKSEALDNPGPEDALAQPPYIPRDPGLYAKNIWEFRDRINNDRAIIDYIRVWQP